MFQLFNKTNYSVSRTLYVLFLTLFSLYSLRLFISPGPSFIWVILFFLIFYCFSKIHPEKQKKKVLISAAITGILFSLMMFLSYQLNINGTVYFDLRALFCALFLAVFFFYSLTGIFSYLLNCSEFPSSSYLSGKNNFKLLALLTALLFLCWLPYLVACFPGNLTSDTIGEIRQQLGLSPLSNQHPVIHQLMIRMFLIPGIILGSVKIGVASYVVFQMLITALIFSYSIAFMVRRNVPSLLLLFSFLFFALYTTNGFYSVTMYKDVPFAGITLLLMIALIRELERDCSSDSPFNRILSLVFLVILSFLFCTIRNNGYYAFLIGFILLILFNLKKFKRLIIVFAVTLLLVNSYNYILFDVIDAKKSSTSEMLGVPLQMIARVVATEDPELNAEEFQVLQEVFPDYSLLAGRYTPNNSDPIKGNGVFLPEVFDKDPVRYFKAWAKIGLQYPRTYLDAFLLHTQGYWDPNKEYSSISAYIYENEFGLSQSERTEPLRVFLINLHVFLSDHSLLSPLYSIGFMVILFIFSFTLLLLKGQLRTASPIFILAALWSTAAAAPCCLYQYVYGLTVTIPLFLCFAVTLPVTQKSPPE